MQRNILLKIVTDDRVVPSPLSTAAQRNKLLRQPIHPESTMARESEDDRDKSKSRRKEHSNNSPPNSEFKTSSPMKNKSDSTMKASEADASTPGVSKIDPASPSPEPRRRSSRRHGSGTKPRSFNPQDGNDEGDQSEEIEDSSDDTQPAGKVTKHERKEKGTMITPSRFPAGRTSRLRTISAECSPPEESSNYLTVSFVLIAMVGVCCAFAMSTNTQCAHDYDNFLEIFRTELDNLKQEFPEQTNKTWNVINSSIKKVLKCNPIQPSVLLFVAQDEEAKIISQCLAQKLSSFTTNLFVYGTEQIEDPLKASSIKSKMGLFDALSASLSTGHTALLFDLEQLEGGYAMALHPFTDNENAPYKNAVIIFTVNADSYDVIGAKLDEVVEKILTEKWSNRMDEDRISPLLSRIVVSTALIKGEPRRRNQSC